MPTFEPGDVIKVPFPYTDRATRQSRPALVVSTAQLRDLHGLLWVVMITSAANRGRPNDVPIANLKIAGLPVPSLIRCVKIATIEASDASKLGRVSAAQLRLVTRTLVHGLGGEWTGRGRRRSDRPAKRLVRLFVGTQIGRDVSHLEVAACATVPTGLVRTARIA